MPESPATSGAAPDTRPRTDWLLVAVLVGAGVFVSFQIGKAMPSIPFIRQDLGIDIVTAGWLLGIYSVTGMLIGVLAGAVADTVGHRRQLVGGLALIALGNVAGALAPGATVLLLSRAVEGLGFISVVVSIPTLLVRSSATGDVRFVMGIWGAYMPFGAALMLVIAPFILEAWDWRAVWWFNALCLVVAIVVVQSTTAGLRAQRRRRRVAEVARDIKTVGSLAGPILLGLAFSTYTGNYIALTGFLPTVFIEVEGFSARDAGFLTALVVVANVVGNVMAGVLLKRGATRWKLIAATSLFMGFCAAMVYTDGLPFGVRLAAAVLFSGVGGLIPGSVMAAAPVLAPTAALVGTVSGLVMQGSNLGQVIGPPAVAALKVLVDGWVATAYYVVTASILGAILAYFLGREEARLSRSAAAKAASPAAPP